MAKKFTLAGNEKFISLLKDDFIPSSINPQEDYAKKYHLKFKSLLKNEKNLENIEGTGELKNLNFKNRFDFGKHLYEVFKNCSFSKINKDEHLWNYISCFYLDKFLTKSKALNRLMYFGGFFDLKRLLSRTPWFLYYINGDDSEFALCNNLNEHSNMCEQYISRQELVRNKSISELCMNLYFDKKERKLKKNSAKHEKVDGSFLPGVIHPRLSRTVGKLNKIHDLWTIDSSDLNKLIGKEFKHWNDE
jgi:hypothetical protein